jgi:SAM-dependent methyltransferase
VRRAACPAAPGAAEATRRAQQAGVAGWISHLRADATALPFPAGSFDASRGERLFQHLLQPERALAEMIRVTKPGGWVVVFDADWGSLSVDTDEVDIERRLARVRGDRYLHNGYVGRRLYLLFTAQGLGDLTIEVLPVYLTAYQTARHAMVFDGVEREALRAGVITQEELDRWHASLESAAATGRFFCSMVGVLVAGRTDLPGIT